MENNNQAQILQKSLTNINAGTNKIYIYNPQVENFYYREYQLYQVAKALVDAGKNVTIIHSDQYVKPKWFADQDIIDSLNHIDVTTNAPTFAPEDIIVAPETDVMFLQDIVQNKIPCKIVLMVNSVFKSHLSINVGVSWNNFGIHDIIVTNDATANYFSSVYGNKLNIHKIPVAVDENIFKDSGKPKELRVALHVPNQEDFLFIVKTFYNKYPHMRYVSMFDMRQEVQTKFAENIERAALAVWVDPKASFGTFPIECYHTNTPLISVVPEIQQEHYQDGCGIWTNNILNLPDLIYQYLVKFQEGAIDEVNPDGSSITDHFSKYSNYVGKYSVKKLRDTAVDVFEKLVNDRRDQFANFLSEQAMALSDTNAA